MPHLRYINESGVPAAIELVEREVVIGRLPDCDIVVSDKTASRRHARVFRSQSVWRIADLGSSHGTKVNGSKVKEAALAHEDKIKIGGSEITFFDDSLATAPRRSKSEPAEPLEATSSLALDPFESTDPSRARSGEVVEEQKIDDAGALMRTTISAKEFDLHSLHDVDLPDDKPVEQATSEGGRLLALVRISDEIHRCPDIPSVCRTALEMSMRATGADRGVIALGDQKAGFRPMSQLIIKKKQLIDGEVRASRTFVDRIVQERVALIARDTDRDVDLSSAKSIVAMDIRSILCAPLMDAGEVLGFVYLDRIGLGRTFVSRDLDLLCVIGYHAAAAIGRLRLAARIREEELRRQTLARFFSADVIRHIEDEARDGHLDPTVSTRELEVTVLFADIVAFTGMSEGVTPQELKTFLDAYYDRMTEIVVDKCGGTLDKYVGDGVMALFGAPFSRGVAVEAKHAVQAALLMRDAIASLRRDFPKHRPLEVRFGLNTGKVVAGMMGSRRRLEYSVLGDAVNVASRLESTAEPGQVLIGENTYAHVRDSFNCEYSGERQVKNRAKAVKVWWVVGPKKGPTAVRG